MEGVDFKVMARVLNELYECLLAILFTFLTWLASLSIQVVTEQVESYSSPFDYEAGRLVIIKWRQSYTAILNFVQDVEEFFGPALLVLTAKQMVLFVVYMFSVFSQMSFMQQMRIFAVTQLLRNFFFMSLLVVASQKMKENAMALADALANFQFNDITIQSEVNCDLNT